MKLPHVGVPARVGAIANKPHVVRAWATFRAVMWRLIPVIVFALIFMQVAVMIDQAHYRNAPASDFLQYTDFSVQNARVGEDVYFKVCRTHQSNIHYTGNVEVFIITNPDQKNEQKVKVYGRDTAGVIDTDCSNKVIRASDFRHEAGTYEMTFCVDFKVKYGYEKEICKTSNRYRIYPQPADLESQITDLQQRLSAAQAELKASGGNMNVPQDKTLNVTPDKATQTPQSSQNPGTTQTTGQQPGGQSGTGVVPPTCALNIFGAGVACGSDGIIRL